MNSTGSIVYAPDYGAYSTTTGNIPAQEPIIDAGYVSVHKSGSIVVFDLEEPGTFLFPNDFSHSIAVLNAETYHMPDYVGDFVYTDERRGFSFGVVFVPAPVE